MAGEVAGAPIPPRRTPSTGNPLLEALEVTEVQAPAGPGAVDPAELARLSQTELYGQLPYQLDPNVRQEVLARSAVDAEGNPVISETGVRPTRLVKRRSRGEGGSDAERMWLTPIGDGRYQISSEGGTTLDTVATEDQVRDLLQTGGWSWDSGPQLDVFGDITESDGALRGIDSLGEQRAAAAGRAAGRSLPDPQMVGRALVEYSKEPGAVGNLARAVADLEVLRKADPDLYQQAIGVAGGGTVDDATDINVQAGLRLAEDAARATAVAADQPSGPGRVGIGEADIPTTVTPSAQELAARIAAAARSPLGVRLPTNDISTQIQVGGGVQPPMASAVQTSGPDWARQLASGYTPSARSASTASSLTAPDAVLGAEVPIGASDSNVGVLGGRRRSISENVGAAGEGFVIPQGVPPGPLAPMPGPQAMGPESPTMDARSSSLLDDLLPAASPALQGSMAFQFAPGSWASDMFGGRRDDLADLIRSAQGLDPFTFSTADMPVQSASDFVASLPPELRARWGQSGMPRMGGVDVAQMPVTLRPSAVRDVTGPTYSADFVPTGGGNATIPRFITDEELARAFTRQQPVPGERFITNNDPGMSTGNIEDIERRLEELVGLRQALEARARFAEDAAQQGRMTISDLNQVRKGVLNEISNLNQEADQLARQAETMSGPGQQMQGFGTVTDSYSVTRPDPTRGEVGGPDSFESGSISSEGDVGATLRPGDRNARYRVDPVTGKVLIETVSGKYQTGARNREVTIDGSDGGTLGAAARRTRDARLAADPAANRSAERYYVLDNIERLREQLRITRPERMAAEAAAFKQRNRMDDRATEMRDAASNVQDEIRRLEGRLEEEGRTYGPLDQDALRRQAEQDLADRAAESSDTLRDTNQLFSAGVAEPPMLSAQRLREIADDVLQPKRDPSNVDAEGRSAGTSTVSRPAAFGAYDSRPSDGRPDEGFLREVAERQLQIDALMPSDAQLLSEAERIKIAKQQAKLQKQLNKEMAQWSGDAQGKPGVNLPMVRARKSAGAAQAAMVEKLMSGSPEERMQALNDLFASTVKGQYTAYKDPETGDITAPKPGESMPESGQEMIRDMDEQNQRWDTRLQRYVGTGWWRPFDAARDAGREDEIRMQNFQPLPVQVRSREGAMSNIQKLAAHPEIGSVENLLYHVLRHNEGLSRDYAPDALRAAAQQLAGDVERMAPQPISPDAGARVGTPSFGQRLQSAIDNFTTGRPTDFVPETTPVDNLVNLLPDADGLRNAEPGAVSRELSQVRYIEQKAAELEEMGYDITPVREQIARIMPALEESYRPPASVPTADNAPQIQLSRDPDELISQIDALKRAADQERAAGNLEAAARLDESLAVRRSQLASVRSPSRLGGQDAAMRGANADVAPVMHSTERPQDFVSVGAFSVPLDGDIGDAIRNAIAGDLLPGQSASAVGAPQVEVIAAPPRLGPEVSVKSPTTPGYFVRRPSQIPQAKIVVRRKYKGGVEPVREFVVDLAQPGEVRPGSATLELGDDGRSFFFVNKDGADPLPSPAEIADERTAERISRAGRAQTSEDEALRITAGGDPQILGSRGWDVDTSNLNNQEATPAPVDEIDPPAARAEADRPQFDQDNVGDSGMDSTGESPRAARLARRAQNSRNRQSAAEARAAEAKAKAEAEAAARQASGSGAKATPAQTRRVTGGRILGGAIGIGAGLAGGGAAIDYLTGEEASAAPILASTLVAEPSREDRNYSADDMLDRVRRARQYQSYLVSGHMMPR